MSQESPNFDQLDWKKLAWEKTPYRGIFIYKVQEENDPDNPSIPKCTIMALKMEPRAKIDTHKHNREHYWTETIFLPFGGQFEITNIQECRQFTTKKPFSLVIHANEIFGLKNMDPLQPLYFYSTMKPGFTGYDEIEGTKIN